MLKRSLFKGWLAGLVLSCFSLPFCLASHTGNSPESNNSLEFIENRNQWESTIKYRAELPGGQLFLTSNRWVYNFLDQKQLAARNPHNNPDFKKASTEEPLRAHAYTVSFLKANPNVKLRTARKTAGFRNYFIGNDPSHWASEVKAYEEVQYPELYPGIEARLYEQKQKLKYEFEVAAGANPNQIQMQYDGADNLQLENGNLVISTSVNTITEQKPFAYQIVKGKMKEVPCNFRLKGNTLSFEFPRGYRKKLPLIIDPTLVYSTYSGSTADNWGFTATYDNQGNIYSGGIVFYYNFGNFPTTPGAYQITKRGTSDIGLIKYNPTLAGPASREWATYLGGNSIETPHSLVVNSQNQLLILGTTSSSNFPTTSGAYSSLFKGGPSIDPLGHGSTDLIFYSSGSDLFIAKLGADGKSLQASTFLGGTGNDGLLNGSGISPVTLVRNYGDQFRGDIITDNNDNIYITSSTSSPNFPVVNGFQNTYGGGTNDAVVSKFDPNLSTLLWSSFLGGSGADAAYSIQVDNQANVYICGGTTSTNLPQTAGAFKANFQTGGGANAIEGFASKINTAGGNASLVRTTYIGASPGYDQTYFLQLDGSNNVYLLGQSAALYPVFPSSGANKPFNARPGQQFIQKLNPDLTTSIFSTNFGSNNGQFNISPTAFLVDNCERIFICGWGGESNQPARGNPNYSGGYTFGLLTTAAPKPVALQSTTDGSDFYLMQLSQNALDLDYATFLGGNNINSGEHVDGGTSRLDKRGFVYHAVCGGCTGTNTFPTTPNAWSLINGNTLVSNGNCNNAAFKFDFAVSSAIAGGTQKVCANSAPFQITGATPAGGVWSGTGVNPTTGVFTPSPALIGTHVLTYTVTVGNCTSFATKTITVNPIPAPSFTGLKNGEYCQNDLPVTLIPNLPGGTFSGTGITNSNQWSPNIAGPGQHIISYTYSDSNSCTVVFTDTARVAIPPALTAGPDEGVCHTSEPFILTGNSPAGGTWSGPGVTPAGLFTPSTGLIGSQTITYTIVYNNCTYKTQKKVVVDPAPEIITTLTLGDCGTDSSKVGYVPLTVKFNNGTTLGKSFVWDFGDGTQSNEIAPEHTYTKVGHYTVYLTTDFGRNCTRTSRIIEITVKEPFMPNIITPNHDNLNDKFQPQVTCLPYSMHLYSRWGNLVYENENYQKTFDGEKLSAGLYYYLLKDSSGKTWKGWLEIVK